MLRRNPRGAAAAAPASPPGKSPAPLTRAAAAKATSAAKVPRWGRGAKQQNRKCLPCFIRARLLSPRGRTRSRYSARALTRTPLNTHLMSPEVPFVCPDRPYHARREPSSVDGYNFGATLALADGPAPGPRAKADISHCSPRQWCGRTHETEAGADPGGRTSATRLDGISAVVPFYLPYLLPLLQLSSIAAHHAGYGAGPQHTFQSTSTTARAQQGRGL